ncbi:nuclear transport factor 2 family protein [Bradyrhizobium diazoefficiens]|uniref:nuclear transport factor 2 family protein n=1 Tax=Bradyrhizobium diazoefficiens TaxID=1355477 RepID=UPI00190A985D|nr:nuclear transport factor 2 family protein [Bradyrhizobium diazoefficiens]QQO16765.1 nuclear transport factor 2 family protein [Bradyrhizobium diazoefficiens]
MNASPLAVARTCLQAYVEKDRAAIEALIADAYHFTSPIDNALDRKSYIEICWPNSETMAGFELIHQAEDGDRAFIVYEGRNLAGKTFRNCEVHTVRDGRLVATEVYFGWDIPHKVPDGQHIGSDGKGHA